MSPKTLLCRFCTQSPVTKKTTSDLRFQSRNAKCQIPRTGFHSRFPPCRPAFLFLCSLAHVEIHKSGPMQLLPHPHFHTHVMIGIKMHSFVIFVIVVVRVWLPVWSHEPVSIDLVRTQHNNKSLFLEVSKSTFYWNQLTATLMAKEVFVIAFVKNLKVNLCCVLLYGLCSNVAQ